MFLSHHLIEKKIEAAMPGGGKIFKIEELNPARQSLHLQCRRKQKSTIFEPVIQKRIPCLQDCKTFCSESPVCVWHTGHSPRRGNDVRQFCRKLWIGARGPEWLVAVSVFVLFVLPGFTDWPPALQEAQLMA